MRTYRILLCWLLPLICASFFVTLSPQSSHAQFGTVPIPGPTYGALQGVVTDSNGTPLTGILVSVMKFDYVSNAWTTQAVTTTASGGNYLLVGLPTGSYRVGFSDDNANDGTQINEFYDNATAIDSASDITISDGATTTINAQLATLTSGILGHVYDMQGNPLADIQVQLYFKFENLPWNPGQVVRTNAQGVYMFADIAAGSYRLEFSDSRIPIHFVSEFYNSAASLAESTDVSVTVGQITVVDAQLEPANQLSGKITDSNGNPIAGANVTIYRDAEGKNTWTQAVYSAQSSETGEYLFEGVNQGSYRVGFSDPAQPRRYSDEYFENALWVLEAQTLIFSKGETRTLDAQLAAPAAISGMVRAPEGQPLAGAMVGLSFWYPGLPERQNVASAYTDEQGKYTLPSLSAGVYQLCVYDPNPSQPTYSTQCYDQKNWNQADDLRLLGGENRVIDFNLGYTGGIHGSVVDSNGAALGHGGVQFVIYRLGHSDQEFSMISFGWLNEVGEYASDRLDTGVYRVCLNDQTLVNFANECFDNAPTLETATDITVTSSTTTTVPDIRLDRLSTISGSVSDGSGSVLEGMRVDALIRNDQVYSGWELKGTAFTDANGNYLIRGLASGVYRVIFSDPYQQKYQEEFFNNYRYLQLAEDITVPISSTITAINAQLELASDVQVAPLALSKTISVSRGGTVNSNDYFLSPIFDFSDADYDIITPTILTQPAHGSFSLNEARTFSYTHNGDDATSDFITYQVTDGILQSEVATVTILIGDSSPQPTSPPSIALTTSVGIAGIEPACGASNQLHVPLSTTVIYCYTLQNNSQYTLNLHTLVDERLGTLFENRLLDIAPGQSYTARYSETLTLSTSSVATWTAQVANVLASTAIANGSANAQTVITISSAQDDQDQDTIPDNLEGASDIDGDNLPNFLDSDADGDAIQDKDEAGDANGNGIPDFLEAAQTSPAIHLYLPIVSR